MSLETVDDAKRVARLSRAEYDLLLPYLEQLPSDGWTAQSACRDWKVYQVVSHLGSQPEIISGVLRAGLRGEPPMTDEQRKAIWARFDGFKPDEVLPAFRKNNDDYYKLADSFTDDELSRTIPWLGGQSAPLATVLAGRLNEQVLHAWDIFRARDKQATLTPEAVPTLLELNTTPARLAGLVKPDNAPDPPAGSRVSTGHPAAGAGQALAGKTIQFRLGEPDGTVALHLDPNGPTASRTPATSPALTAELPTEAFVRLLWGRYDVRSGLHAGQLKLDRPELADALQAVFPGR